MTHEYVTEYVVEYSDNGHDGWRAFHDAQGQIEVVIMKIVFIQFLLVKYLDFVINKNRRLGFNDVYITKHEFISIHLNVM